MDSKLPKTVQYVALPPPTENIGKKIIMFGLPTCPDCTRVKKFFSENAIEYEYHDLTIDKASLKWTASFTSFVPVLIMLDEEIMYSPTNLQLLDKIKGTSVNKKVSLTEPVRFDCIIIGAGPAGITAAIYSVRKALKVLVVTKTIGGQAVYSGGVENYPGFSLIAGNDLATKFKENIERFQGDGLWIKEGVEVKSIDGSDNNFIVKTDLGEYFSKTIIIASGRVPKLLDVPGEKEFLGKGVATCANCDGPLFKGRDVAIIGGGNSALDTAVYLKKIVKSIKIINSTDSLKGDSILLEQVLDDPKIEVLNDHLVKEIRGLSVVEEIFIQDSKTHETKSIPVSGVFIEVGWEPSVDFVSHIEKDKKNQILVNEFCETSIRGIYAAGDVNNLWGEQIIIAAGEGAKAALIVAEHIAKIPHQVTSNVHEG